MGVPAGIAGLRVVHAGGLIDTAREYSAAVILLAAIALVGVLRRRPAPAPACSQALQTAEIKAVDRYRSFTHTRRAS